MKELQAHTMEISHVITKKEMEELCRIYHITDKEDIRISDTMVAGINEICICKNPVISDGSLIKYTYTMKLRVNVGRLLRKSDISMVELTNDNVNVLIKKLDSILARKFHLNSDNSNSAEWKLVRLDCGHDLKMGTDNSEIIQTYIQLLHKAFITTNSRNCQLTRYKGYDNPEVKRESITINNSSYAYNIYYKYLEYIKKHNDLSNQKELDEIKDVIRIEKQLEGKGLNVLGRNKKLSVLLEADVLSNIMSGIISEVELLFGKGSYVAESEAMAIIDGSRYKNSDKVQMKLLFLNVTNYGYQETCDYLMKNRGVSMPECKALMDKYRKMIETCGVSLTGLSETDVERLGCKTLENILTILNKSLVSQQRKRTRGKFGSIRLDKKYNRYKCNFTIHDNQGQAIRTSVAGKTIEETEMKILLKIKERLNENMKFHKGNIAEQKRSSIIVEQELQDFKTIIDRPAMVNTLNECIRQVREKIDELKEMEERLNGSLL